MLKMNQSEADSVKDLAKPVVEALGRITERECPQCKGAGEYIVDIGGPGIENSEPCTEYCSKCFSTGKVKWKWEPKVGEFYLLYGKLHLVTDPLIARERFINVWKKDGVKPIPILPWEELERVLEGVDYKLVIEPKRFNTYSCYIYDSNHKVWAKDKERQPTVMKAVIQLGKELHAKSK